MKTLGCFFDNKRFDKEESGIIYFFSGMDLSVAADEGKNIGNNMEDSINLKAFRFKEILGEDGARKVVNLFFTII